MIKINSQSQFTILQSIFFIIIINKYSLMLNPINQKLDKMRKAIRAKLKVKFSTDGQLISFRFQPTNQNDCNHSNNFNGSSILSLKSGLLKSQTTTSEIPQGILLQYQQDNKRLKDQIKTHEMMQQFYLKQLQEQKKTQQQLQWRLTVLSQELQNSNTMSGGKTRRYSCNSNILMKRVEVARKGMERMTEDSSLQ